MSVFLNHPIIPVLSVNDLETALGAVSAMQQGGIACVEVALRTPNALKILESLATKFPELAVGAGTLKVPEDFARVQSAGACFAVSPGSTQALLEESKRWDLPYLPAASTVSEILTLLGHGFKRVKLFPAQTLGGVQYLKDIAAPLGEVEFIPSGGVSMQNYQEYLALPSVIAVSGTWMLQKAWLGNKNWDEITRVSRESLISLPS